MKFPFKFFPFFYWDPKPMKVKGFDSDLEALSNDWLQIEKDIDGIFKLLQTKTAVLSAQKKMELHRRYNNITFRAIRKKDKLIIEAKQGRTHSGQYFDAKRLREIVHETFDGAIKEPFHASGIPHENER